MAVVAMTEKEEEVRATEGDKAVHHAVSFRRIQIGPQKEANKILTYETRFSSSTNLLRGNKKTFWRHTTPL